MARNKAFYFIILILFLNPFGASAKIKRSPHARHDFVRSNACPSTGKSTLPCPGYIIDHVIPLCAGGKDDSSNMQWQTVEEAKEKDKKEWAQCRSLKSKK